MKTEFEKLMSQLVSERCRLECTADETMRQEIALQIKQLNDELDSMENAELARVLLNE